MIRLAWRPRLGPTLEVKRGKRTDFYSVLRLMLRLGLLRHRFVCVASIDP